MIFISFGLPQALSVRPWWQDLRRGGYVGSLPRSRYGIRHQLGTMQAAASGGLMEDGKTLPPRSPPRSAPGWRRAKGCGRTRAYERQESVAELQHEQAERKTHSMNMQTTNRRSCNIVLCTPHPSVCRCLKPPAAALLFCQIISDTCVCEKNTPPETKILGSISLKNAKSGAGEQFMPLGSRGNAPV